MIKLICIYLLSITSFFAYADSNYLKKKQKQCGEHSNYKHIYGCYKNLHKESDRSLNSEYNKLLNYLKEPDKINLINAQRKWIQFRDADCLFSDPRENENIIAAANKAACLYFLTTERLEHLEKYNKPWNKGCNGCPW